jgi:hypothetical protein
MLPEKRGYSFIKKAIEGIKRYRSPSLGVIINGSPKDAISNINRVMFAEFGFAIAISLIGLSNNPCFYVIPIAFEAEAIRQMGLTIYKIQK